MAGHKPLTLKTEKVLIGSFESLPLEGIGEETVGMVELGERMVDALMDDSELLWGPHMLNLRERHCYFVVHRLTQLFL